ncbi:MAG: biotin--[acetyl-CoA-carboxylase] ligase [Candidatus Paceibacterota bacterium]|jgi:BirA family biotin operon repressor/biotin-[acetyl-CoA-carboxylase] ligase
MIIKSFSQLDSTNTKAKELAQNGAAPWTVVIADEQTNGYGKDQRGWFSPKGGLYFSIILPESNIDDLQTLTILAAFAAAKTIMEEFNLQTFIKLPNDVWTNNKKIAGILTENIISGKKIKHSVMGIGLDTNIEKFPKELASIATSLRIELGREVDDKDLMEKIVGELKKQLETISR